MPGVQPSRSLKPTAVSRRERMLFKMRSGFCDDSRSATCAGLRGGRPDPWEPNDRLAARQDGEGNDSLRPTTYSGCHERDVDAMLAIHRHDPFGKLRVAADRLFRFPRGRRSVLPARSEIDMPCADASVLRAKIAKLKRRLDHQRLVGLELETRSLLFDINTRAVIEMELKLFRLRQSLKPALQSTVTLP